MDYILKGTNPRHPVKDYNNVSNNSVYHDGGISKSLKILNRNYLEH